MARTKSGESFGTYLHKALEGATAPMSPSEIVAAARKAGFAGKGTDASAKAYLSQVVRKGEHGVVRAGRGLYQLAGQTFAAATTGAATPAKATKPKTVRHASSWRAKSATVTQVPTNENDAIRKNRVLAQLVKTLVDNLVC